MSSATPALLANIRLNDPEKFEFFRTTLRDVAGLFVEAHLKFRGQYAREAVAYAGTLGFQRLTLHQELPEHDWVAATREMLRDVTARSVFLYFEDHRLLASQQTLAKTLADFEATRADMLCYSFFRASRLGPSNLLPFETRQGAQFDEIVLDEAALRLLGRVSPKYYTFSLMSIVSVEHFRRLLSEEDVRWKWHARRVSALATILFPYPEYRRFLRRLNIVLARVGVRICFYHPSSPFNLERMWLETAIPPGGLRIAVPKQELFANCDDDNGAIGESCVKRGLYPLSDVVPPDAPAPIRGVRRMIELPALSRFDLTYHSAIERIRVPPRINIRVKTGAVTLKQGTRDEALRAGDHSSVFANLGGELVARQASSIEIEILDEAF